MRWAVVPIVAFGLLGCIPRSTPPQTEAPQRPAAQTPLPRVSPSADTLQCHAALAREDVQFRILPDREFGGGCTAIGAVQLTEIGTPVTNLGAMRCPLARAFASWVREAVQPEAARSFGSPVRRIESFGTYACRPVNSQSGARLSEHAFANAVDVAVFVLADGRRISVKDGWNGEDRASRNFLRAVHRAGCGRFSVVLSPDSDAFHQDHLHFDLGRGPYCR